MPVWKTCIRAGFGLSLICLAGCGASRDALEPSESTAASAILTDPFKPGNGFLIDREERLLLTANRLIDGKPEVEVAFAIIEDGKVLNRKSDWLAKARAGKTVKGKVIIADPDRDLAVVQLASVPEGVSELPLAKAGVKKGAEVRFLGAPNRANAGWAALSSSVENVAPRKVDLENNKKATNRMIELTAEARAGTGVGGSALVNEGGEVVGVLAAGLPEAGRLLATDLSEIRPVAAAAYRTLAMRAYQKRQYDTAIAYSVRALATWPDDPLGYNERGAAYSQKDQFDKAIEDYSRSIALEPSLPLAYRNRGSAHFHLGRYKNALADCTKAIELDPTYLSAYRTRTQVYAKLKMKKEAEADDRMIAKLSKPQPKKVEWQGTVVSGDPNIPSVPGANGDGTITARTPGGGTVRLRPPVPGDPYYRGPGGRRYLVIPNHNPDLSKYPGLSNYPGNN